MAILGDRQRRNIARSMLAVAALGLALAPSLSGCGSVDEMRMRIDETEHGAVTAQVSANFSGDNEIASDEQIENSSAYRQLNGFSEKLTTRCNVRHLLYPREGTAYLDLRADFADVDDLNSTLRCAAVNVDHARVDFERHSGFLWNTFVLHFTIGQKRPRCPDTGVCPSPQGSFPRVILLNVPGKVHRIGNASQLVGFDLNAWATDDDTVRVEARPSSDYQAYNLRHFGGRTGPDEIDEIKIDIESRVANFNVGTILSVIGMIFGSGLLIQGSRWLLSRHKEEKKAGTAPSAKPGGRD